MNRRKDNIFGNRKPAWLKTWRGFGSGPKLMLLALRDYRALVMFDEFEQMRATLPPEAPAASSSSPEEFPIDFTLAS